VGGRNFNRKSFDAEESRSGYVSFREVVLVFFGFKDPGEVMKKLMLSLPVLVFCLSAFAEDLQMKIACKAAAANMPNGNGASVYYSNGNTLTNSAGRAGASWYYPDGRTLTSNVAVPGASYYHSNGNTFSSNTGVSGASWYYSNGNTITNSGPALTPGEMAKLACDLILDSK